VIDLSQAAETVAPLLLGYRVQTRVDGILTEVALTEVEAYSQEDPASHSYGGPRGRNTVMYGPPGRLYVYRSYGIHWCANVVCGPEGAGAAVLMRGGRPTKGRADMVRRRRRSDHLTDGPGKLCEALGIDSRHNGIDLLDRRSPVRLLAGESPPAFVTARRIGITKAAEVEWRFIVADRR
jgi:DNA-3-methyladenine glycosylase